MVASIKLRENNRENLEATIRTLRVVKVLFVVDQDWGAYTPLQLRLGA